MFSNKNNKLIAKMFQGGQPQMGGPQMGGPQMGGPQMGGPQMGQPQMGETQIGGPQMGQPQMGQPQMGGPQMGQPQMGGPQMGQPQMGQPQMEQLQIGQPQMVSQPPINQLSIEHENYPNADYLYNKFTSQNFVNNIKTYVCAFTINKDIDTHFVKYIVQHKDSYVTFPSFTFEPNEPIMTQQPNEPIMTQQPNEPIMTQQPNEPIMTQQPNEPLMTQQPNEPIMTQQPNEPIMTQQPNEPLMTQQPNEPIMTQQPNEPIMTQQQVPGQIGGFQDDSSGDENPLDTNFKSKVIEFVKTNIYGGLLEPSYVGYIPNISEQDAVFVFVKIDDAHNKHFMGLQTTEFFESIPNELFHLSKVFNFDVEQPVKDLFTNNKWLYMEQPLASPFSGYLCKLEGTEIKNAGIGEEPGNFNINIDNIGDFFYFSFLPLDPNNAKSYQRYALLPMEYECILDNSNLEYYKQNMMLYQNSNSIYFKGEILSNQKEGNQFFAIRSPTQFTQL
jgi:hypothetical protein